jgi:F0F1-type ATP synthase epsilon subunit
MKILTMLMFAMMTLVPVGIMSSAAFERDRPQEMNRAQESLRAAKNELEHAGDEWGGHRSKAIQHINAALTELDQAERFAREHHK